MANLKNWLTFIEERFSPSVYIPTIVLFVGSGAVYARSNFIEQFEWWRLLCIFPLILSFFFRLRLFDEIKDYDVDKIINPTRPLARGLLKIKDVRKVIGIQIVTELFLANLLGGPALICYSGALLYSLLMFEEFFIGDFLRVHLTTYAITHTIVVTLQTMLILVSFSPNFLTHIQPATLAFLGMNWMMFNLFEFARKTFAREEEKEAVDSYSKIFGITGAVILSLTQALLALILLNQALAGARSLLLIFGLFMAYTIICVIFASKKTVPLARNFRNISGLYLFLFYFLLIWILF